MLLPCLSRVYLLCCLAIPAIYPQKSPAPRFTGLFCALLRCFRAPPTATIALYKALLYVLLFVVAVQPQTAGHPASPANSRPKTTNERTKRPHHPLGFSSLFLSSHPKIDITPTKMTVQVYTWSPQKYIHVYISIYLRYIYVYTCIYENAQKRPKSIYIYIQVYTFLLE